MKKDEHNEVEMIIETGAEPEKVVPVVPADVVVVEDEDVAEPKQEVRPESESSAALKRITESTSEGDEAPVGSLSLKQILGGIDQMEKKLVDAKYKALASSSNLTELCRQSNVLKALHENQDTLLQLSDQPPYIIEVPED